MTFDRTALLDTLCHFVTRLLTCYEVDETLDDLATAVTGALGLAGTAIDLGRDGRLACATAAPPAIRDLEDVQVERQAGPCVDAYHSGQPVTVPDLEAEPVPEDWGAYVAVARRLGVRAAAGVPMRYDGRSVGSVNLYDTAPRAWTDEDLATLTILADVATGYLVNASKVHQQQQLADQLTEALETRVVFEQAKGIVAAQRHLSVEDAFQAIKRHARSHHLSVRTVAEAIVHVGLRL